MLKREGKADPSRKKVVSDEWRANEQQIPHFVRDDKDRVFGVLAAS